MTPAAESRFITLGMGACQCGRAVFIMALIQIILETAFEHAKTQRRKKIQIDVEQAGITGQVNGLI